MQKSYLFGLLLCSLGSLCAQTTESSHLLMVVDDQGESLVAANIANYLQDQFLGGTISYEDGMAEISLTGDRIEISYIGYHTEVYSPQELANMGLVELQPNKDALPTVEVVAYAMDCGCFCGCGHTTTYQLIELTEPILEEPEPVTEIRIYPNPSVDWVQVETTGLKGLVHLYSLDGRLVEQQLAQNEQVQFDLTNKAVGLYLVVYQNEVLGKVQRGSRSGGSAVSGAGSLVNW